MKKPRREIRAGGSSGVGVTEVRGKAEDGEAAQHGLIRVIDNFKSRAGREVVHEDAVGAWQVFKIIG
jgi:hypothetical protein